MVVVTYAKDNEQKIFALNMKDPCQAKLIRNYVKAKAIEIINKIQENLGNPRNYFDKELVNDVVQRVKDLSANPDDLQKNIEKRVKKWNHDKFMEDLGGELGNVFSELTENAKFEG